MTDRRTPPPFDDEDGADFEARLGDWLGARGLPESAELATVRASIDSLPRQARHRGSRWLGAAAAAAVVALAGGLAIAGRLAPAAAPGATHGGPGSWASDPRVALCGAPDDAAAIFELAHLRDYRTTFPAMHDLVGLPDDDLAAPALVVVSATPGGSTRLMPTDPPAPGSSSPLLFGVCFVVGTGPGSWKPIDASADLTGFVPPAISTDPANWTGDPRFASCAQGHVAEPTIVFEMTHAQWFPLYLPDWGWQGAEELEVDEPALVVLGSEGPIPAFGGRPGTSDVAPRLGRQMCIAVGSTSGFIVHDKGVSTIGRVVPILSPEDVGRAVHLDPEVLADPARWAGDRARLRACGGTDADIQYLFDLRPLSDLVRVFPAFESSDFDTDESVTIVVFRNPSPLAIRRRVDAPSGPTIHDVCVVYNDRGGEHALLPDVDLTGFHLRLSRPDPSAPPASAVPPSSTPLPGPAWAGDARAALSCAGDASLYPTERTPGTNAGTYLSPEEALRWHLDVVRTSDEPVPVDGFAAVDQTADARLFTARVGAGPKAAIVVTAGMIGPDRVWIVTSVAACPIAELDPTVPTGHDPFAIWTDTAGGPVPESILAGIADCYGGTQVRFRDHLYVRTPMGGVDPSQVEMTWSLNATLPAATSDSGYRSGTQRLFARVDGKAIYVVDGERIERLPHVIGDEVIRTDCN